MNSFFIKYTLFHLTMKNDIRTARKTSLMCLSPFVPFYLNSYSKGGQRRMRLKCFLTQTFFSPKLKLNGEIYIYIYSTNI